ncbi:MAG TPA: cation:proton antiporter [Candidatus Saccharimonadales bacterium]|nr:cation:proton antiporter [Candidatus Saccharimonadales bacterium]
MEQSIFYQLSLVLVLATVISLIFRALKQPLIIGYIVTGFLAGPSLLGLIHDHEAFESFSQIGIALLLFIIGLGLNAAVVKSTGKPVLVTFLVITLGVGGLGLGASKLLGFSSTESVIMAVALLFSSTIIVVKSLSDKKEQSRLYGQIAIGVLLIEDLAATIALLLVATSGNGTVSAADFGLLFAKGVGLGAGLAFLGVYVMPRFARLFAGSQELLYIFALAWGFGVASVFWWAGFSIEVGALFAGVALAHLPYAQGIATRLKPLRDFFIVLFFIGLGEELGISNISAALVPALVFSLIIMMSKPLLTVISLGVLGYTKQTGFKAAVRLSQISEFSIVLVVLAANTGAVNDRLITVITLTALITIALSTYLMQYDERLYRLFEKPLSYFERAETKQELRSLQHYPLVLLGYHEGGYEFVRTFRRMKKPYVVIDYNPEVIDSLEAQHINHLYGDATDFELLDEIGLHRAEIIVSSINDTLTNKLILEHIVRRNKDAIFICHATSYDDAEALYERGAAYVIMPHFIGSEQINDFIRENGTDKKAFEAHRRKHLTNLESSGLIS